MEVPTEEKIKLINKAIVLLEPQSVRVPPKRDNLVSIASVEKVVEAKKIDRQVKVVLIILYDRWLWRNENHDLMIICF
jgi:hypothetical protein